MLKQTQELNGGCSFVIPVHNEEATIRTLFDQISKVILQENIPSYEVIFIDDGSNDGSWLQIQDLVSCNPRIVKGIKFRRNFGKSAALWAGFRYSSGDIVFTLDADLQDDPEEIPKFLYKLEMGFDLVSGWRQKRNDPLSKKLPSKLFNKVTSTLTGIHLHDFNCGFKVYRRKVLDSIQLYGELHRYTPVLAHELGFKVGEVVIEHHSRKHGFSKYSWERYTRGFIDLLTVIATTRYIQKPGHLFGHLGLFSGFIGVLILAYMTILWFLGSRPIGTRPLFFFGIMSIILSVQLISLGILAELIARSRTEPDYIDKQICEIIDEHNGNHKSTQKFRG